MKNLCSTTGLVDFHCHLDLYPNHKDLILECERLGIRTLAVTNAPAVWSRNRDLAAGAQYVRVALGLHPQLAAQRQKEIGLFEQFLSETRYVGEVGLDGSRNFRGSLNVQRRVFRQILELCAISGDKILSVHSRQAVPEVLSLLDATEFLRRDRGKIILHWFTGSLAEARRALDMGVYFSVNQRMTTTGNGRRLIEFLPTERLLTESDGPFVSYKDKPITPKAVLDTVNQISSLRRTTAKEIQSRILDNLRRLLQ